MTDFEKLIGMIECYAEHIYDETHGKDELALNEKSAISDDHYFDDVICYGENFLTYCKAAQALARAKQVMDEEDEDTTLTVTRKEEPKEEPKYDYVVVVYGGFDETPLVKYQRDYDDKDQAIMTYHDLEDTFRLEHKIFDNNTEEFIDQEECSAMAVIKIGAFDDEEVISFKSLLDKTNLSYNNDYKQIVDYLVENCKL
jgi:transglutaminase/protease-like cytokinesis protein 3